MDKVEQSCWEGSGPRENLKEHMCALMDLLPSQKHVTGCMQTPRALCPLRFPALLRLDWMKALHRRAQTHMHTHIPYNGQFIEYLPWGDFTTETQHISHVLIYCKTTREPFPYCAIVDAFVYCSIVTPLCWNLLFENTTEAFPPPDVTSSKRRCTRHALTEAEDPAPPLFPSSSFISR